MRWLFFLVLASCQYFKEDHGPSVSLPSLATSSSECFYLDQFMPVPNSLVAGKTGNMETRYYSYQSAVYKDWHKGVGVRLAFVSQDGQCWSLVKEEQY